MNIMAIFVLGLLIGWLAEWVIDWYYWRGRIFGITSENAYLQGRINSLEAEKNLWSEPDRHRSITNQHDKDDFQAIKGIGPVFSKRLHEAGVHSFEQLSMLTPKEMEEILGELYKRFFSKQNSILAQAKGFTQEKAPRS